MKRFLLVVVYLLYSFILLSQPAKNSFVTLDAYNELENQVNQMEGQLKQLDNQVKYLKSQNQEIDKFKESQEESIKQASQTITNQNSLISSFGIIYSLLTVLIAVVAIAVPFINYRFLKEIDNRIDNKVARYLENKRDEKLTKFAKALNRYSKEIREEAIKFFKINRFEDFKDNHLKEFYKHVKEYDYQPNPNEEGRIISLLTSHENKYATKLFGNPEILNKSYFYNDGLPYIIRYATGKCKKTLIAYLNYENGLNFKNFITVYQKHSSTSTWLLLNDKELIDGLTKETLINLKNQVGIKEITGLKDEYYLSTYFYRKMKAATEEDTTL